MENNEVVVKQKSNKGVIIVLIVLVLGLCSYIVCDKFIVKENPKSVNEKQERETKEENKNETIEKEVLLKDKTKEVVYTYADNDIYSEHKVPQINIDSDYADNINQSILSFYNEFKNSSELVESYTGYRFNYKYYIEDETVSIVVSHTTEDGAENPTKVYNINKYTGLEVKKSEILKKFNINEYDLSDKFNKSYNVINIIGLYPNNNQLYVVFDIKTNAGAGHQQTIFDFNNDKLIDIYDEIIK